jgi:hypothetical protein
MPARARAHRRGNVRAATSRTGCRRRTAKREGTTPRADRPGTLLGRGTGRGTPAVTRGHPAGECKRRPLTLLHTQLCVSVISNTLGLWSSYRAPLSQSPTDTAVVRFPTRPRCLTSSHDNCCPTQWAQTRSIPTHARPKYALRVPVALTSWTDTQIHE